MRHPVNVQHIERATFGQRVADRAVAALGSWRFIIGQSLVMVAWVTFNTLALTGRLHFDGPPFILLNLMLSTQAGIAGPLILLASNRQSQKDRDMLEHTFTDTERLLARLDRNTQATLAIASHLRIEFAEETEEP